MNTHELPSINSSGQPEIYRLLKIGDFATPALEPEQIESVIPVQVEQSEVAPVQPSDQFLSDELRNRAINLLEHVQQRVTSTKQSSGFALPLKGMIIYPAVFVGSFMIFYTAMNFPSMLAQAQGIFAKSQDQEILGEELEKYNQWIKGYFYSVSESDLLNPNNDYDKDGLTNYDEFVLRTNPTLADSDSDGTMDGVEILNASNPWGSGDMTRAQKKLLGEINVNMVSERISYNVSANQGQSTTATDANNFDLDRPGVLSIPKLRTEVPLVWSKDPSTFDADLKKGVIHYPGTAMPGALGTMYVSGHSSDYFWNKNKYGSVFSRINQLREGDDVFVTVYGKDGKVYNYRYRVTAQKVFSPDDQTQFIDNTHAKLNLSTCWPIGTAKDRMVVTAILSDL